MAEFINDTLRIARKEHRCTFCGDVIKKGERYRFMTYVDGGKLYTDKYHENCAFAISQNCDYGDDEYFTDEIMETINEELRGKGITPAATIHEAVNQWRESIKIAE